jgi:uncharacterized oxidoreductase
MKLTGNTIFITGGGSGIGRGFAEAFRERGNKVIISGRRRANVDEVVAANPGMAALELDIIDPASIDTVAARLIADHPEVNVLINNAGIMLPDHADGRVNDRLLVDTVTTHLIGPIRITSALVEHLKGKNDAVIVYTSSVLGFVPMAVTAVYSATKAALHFYAFLRVVSALSLERRRRPRTRDPRRLGCAPTSRTAERPRRRCRSTNSSQRQWQCSARMPTRS